MQISYHSALTKIQKKKKLFFVPASIARNWAVWPVRSVFKPVRNVGVSIPVYISVWYIPTGTGTGTVLTSLTFCSVNSSAFIIPSKKKKNAVIINK